MKVAISVFGDISKNDGTTVRAKRIFEILRQYFDTIMVGCTYMQNEIDSSPQIMIVKIPKARQLVQLPFWFAGLFLTLIKRRFDLIYCSNDWYGFALYYLFSKIFKYQIVFEAHGILSEEYKELGRSSIILKFAQLWEKFVITHSSMIIALSKTIYNFYSRYNENINLIPVFVDTQQFSLDIEKRQKLRKEYGLWECKVIGIIGPFDSRFNKHFLEFVYENIHHFENRIKIMVIGGGASPKTHKKLVYTDYVEDYIGFLSCLDAVLIPSRLSTSGPLNKIIEPMSLGLPVFTTPKGVYGLDYVKNEENIFIFNENEIVEKMIACIFDNKLMEKVGLNARKTIEKYYSKEINGEKLIKILSDLH